MSEIWADQVLSKAQMIYMKGKDDVPTIFQTVKALITDSERFRQDFDEIATWFNALFEIINPLKTAIKQNQPLSVWRTYLLEIGRYLTPYVSSVSQQL